MKLISVTPTMCVLGFAMAMNTVVLAQSPPPVENTKAQKDQTETLVKGEIRKIDKSTGKLTIKHGPINHLDMPPMTMVFNASDKSTLEPLKVGDQIEFSVSNDNGKMTVTTINRLTP